MKYEAIVIVKRRMELFNVAYKHERVSVVTKSKGQAELKAMREVGMTAISAVFFEWLD